MSTLTPEISPDGGDLSQIPMDYAPQTALEALSADIADHPEIEIDLNRHTDSLSAAKAGVLDLTVESFASPVISTVDMARTTKPSQTMVLDHEGRPTYTTDYMPD